MDHSKKLAFIHRMTKLGLEHVQHFDSGGTVQEQGNVEAPATPGSNPNGPSTMQAGQDMVTNVADPTKQGLNPFGAANQLNNVVASLPSSPQQNQFQGSSMVNNSATNPNTGILGTIGDFLGTNDQFIAQGANITPGANMDQLNNSYSGVQNALTNQDNLAGTLSPQASAAVRQQQELARMYQQQAIGRGPNVARSQLNEATGQNIASQNALMAGQRGASSNVGLIARQAAQQGAATQQQAAGQAATLGAQQQIAAQDKLANLSANQVSQAGQAVTNQNQAQQGEQNILQNANTSANNAAVGMQSNINNNNAQTAAANQNSNTNILGGIMGAGSSALSSLFAEGGEVDDSEPAESTDEGSFHAAPSSPSNGPSLPSSSTLPANTTDLASAAGGGKGGGGGGGGGGMMSLMALLAKGGPIVGNQLTPQNAAMPMPQSFVGQWLTSSGPSSGPEIQSSSHLPANTEDLYSDASNAASKFKKGQPKAADSMKAKGGQIKKNLSAQGGKVKADSPKQKATVKDNSYANDKIPALLSEGEVVIPRKIMMHPEAAQKAAEFVAAIIAKKGLKKRKTA